MADFDDDFGDIYADDEAHASSAIHGVSQCYTESEEDRYDNDNSTENADTFSAEVLVSDSKKPSSISGEKIIMGSEDYSESDSEDDLNIVLNDDEKCKGIPLPINGGGSLKLDDYEDEDADAFVATKDSKYVWTQGSTCPSNGKANESVDLVLTVSVGGEYNVCNQQRGARDTPNSVVSRNRYGFRLPWYRTILDMDIESFMEKSWRYPGVDITDYFNFDLNEDSWKEYCNSLKQLRLMKSTQYGFNQAKEVGSEFGRYAQETVSNDMNCAGSRTFSHPSSTVSDCRPKGQAIQIEDSIFERQPSFDIRHPRSWDSDVVIQISVQDPTQETYNSGVEDGDIDSSTHESENSEVDANGNQNNLSHDSTNDDDESLGTLEVNTEKPDRSSQQISASQPMAMDSDNHRNDQVLNADVNIQKDAYAISSEAIERTNKVTESPHRNTLCADEGMVDTQLSLGDEDQLSLFSSCSESDSEVSKNSGQFDPEDIHTPERSLVSSHTEPHKSVSSSCKNSRSNCIKRKQGDIEDDFICRTSIRKKSNHQDRRLCSVIEPNHHRSNDNDVWPASDREDHNNRNCSQKFRRRKERHHDFGGSHRDHLPDNKEPNFSSRYGISYADNHLRSQLDNKNYWSGKGSHKFQVKVDPYVKRNFKGRESFCEDMDTDQSHFERMQFAEERNPLTSRESRGLRSRYSSTVERDAHWRRKRDKLLFKKVASFNDGYFDHKFEGDFIGEKAGGYASFTDGKRNHLDDWGPRGGCVDSPIYFDDSHLGASEDEYCKHRENRYLSRQSFRELYRADEGGWNHCISPRNDVSYPRSTDERYWRHERKIEAEEHNEINWFDDQYGAYEVDDNNYPNDHLRWRRPNWESGVVHWTEDRLILRHHVDESYSEKASWSYQKYVRHDNFHAKYGPLREGMPIDNMQPEQRRLKIPRKGTGANFVIRSAKMYKGKHEQAVRCMDSMNLAVRERKTFAKCSRTMKCNDSPENMGAEIGGERITSETAVEKVVLGGNNQKGHLVLAATAQNADLDIEEGQIVAGEELNAAPGHCVKKRMYDCHKASNGNKAVEGYDQQRILQTMAKMEQRGERFKEPFNLKKESDKPAKPEVDLMLETADDKQHRPSRKRQWGGRFPLNDSLMLGVPLKATF